MTAAKNHHSISKKLQKESPFLKLILQGHPRQPHRVDGHDRNELEMIFINPWPQEQSTKILDARIQDHFAGNPSV